jgi:hypothetical protein
MLDDMTDHLPSEYDCERRPAARAHARFTHPQQRVYGSPGVVGDLREREKSVDLQNP